VTPGHVEHADLRCDVCDRVTEHELHYAGRLLESVRCTRCGHRFEVTPRALVPAYLHDLEQRVVSKPRRMLRRTRQDPFGYLRGLPRSVLRQPGKLLAEVRSLFDRS
jgi:predicted Zn finger-like uncharacterized protein